MANPTKELKRLRRIAPALSGQHLLLWLEPLAWVCAYTLALCPEALTKDSYLCLVHKQMEAIGWSAATAPASHPCRL